MNAFKEDYRLKVCVNLLLRSICSDVLTAIYLLTFYDKDDPENISLKNELDIISTEYLRSVKKIIEEDHELMTLLSIEPTTSIEEKRKWYNSVSENLSNEDGKLKTKNQIRLTTNDEIKEGLKTGGLFISEDEKYQRIKDKGFTQFGFAFTIFKYYSQFQHFTLSSRDLIEHEPFHDTFFMSLTIDQMLMTIDLILQISNTQNPDFRAQIKTIRDKLSENLA